MSENNAKGVKRDGEHAGPGARMRFEKPKDAKRTLARLMGYVIKNKAMIVLVLFLVLLSSGA